MCLGTAVALFDDPIDLLGEFLIDAIKEELKLLIRVRTGVIRDKCHLLLELNSQEAVVDSEDPLHFQAGDVIVVKVRCLKARIDEIDDGDVPLLIALSLLEANVTAGLELDDQFVDLELEVLVELLLEHLVNLAYLFVVLKASLNLSTERHLILLFDIG